MALSCMKAIISVSGVGGRAGRLGVGPAGFLKGTVDVTAGTDRSEYCRRILGREMDRRLF